MSDLPHRKRMKRWESPADIRFITFSCEQRLPLLGNAKIRDLFASRLSDARDRFGFELYAWVVMPEHIHMIVRPPSDLRPLGPMLDSLKKSVARRVIDHWREARANILSRITRPDGAARFWQKGGGFDRNIRDQHELAREIVYIHRNPVERGLVERPEYWRWSSAACWLGDADCMINSDAVPWIEQHRRPYFV